MRTTQTKNYPNVSINELKEDLRIAASDNTYNSELTRLYKDSISIAETFIGRDIVPTVNTLEDYYFCGSCYQINEPGITISSITLNDTTPVTGYTLLKFNQYTVIKFYNSVSADKINIVYNSGSSVIPYDIGRAIKLKVGELFDADRNGYVNGAMKESKTFERLLSPHRTLIY